MGSNILRKILCIVFVIYPFWSKAQNLYDTTILPADAMPEQFVPSLMHKRVGLVINQTSKVGDSSLLDILISRGVNVVAIFVPEHGFRGHEDAGAHIDNATDSATHIPIISLYGNHKKPKPEDLAGIDIIVYDLQDVGVRFYTYISTLQYCMEACGQNRKQFIVLDRPDPNGFYVDGPVLEKSNRSFVGMQPIPIVYGMTCGEYAKMLAGEHWLDSTADVEITVIPCAHYTHKKKCRLPVAPSPNLQSMAAVYAYPSLCLFEGTPVSVGRGTAMSFQQYGCPEFAGRYDYSFTPQSREGAKKPLYEGVTCFGHLIGEKPDDVLTSINYHIQLNWLIDAYKAYPVKDKFFTSFFKSLSGTALLQKQITDGFTSDQIANSWEDDLSAFKKIRKKYLLYKDF